MDTYINMVENIFLHLSVTYGQDNPIPESLDITIGGERVHIESMPCFAIAAYQSHAILIAEFREDDGNLCGTGVENYAAGWLSQRVEMYARMYAYLSEHCTPLYYQGMPEERGYQCGFKAWKPDQNKLT